jgi:hypothetical protein
MVAAMPPKSDRFRRNSCAAVKSSKVLLVLLVVQIIQTM